MSKPFGVFCCLVFLALISSSTSYNPFEKFGVYCKPETYTRPVTKSGCGSQKVRVKACLGTCASYTLPLDHSPHFKKVCECCKPSSTQMVTFNLPDCQSGISPIVQVESAVQCKCKMCTWKKTISEVKGILHENWDLGVTQTTVNRFYTQKLFHPKWLMLLTE